MLKALRQALLDEVVRGSDVIQGANFTNLYNFVSLLADVSWRAMQIFVANKFRDTDFLF